MPRGEPSVLSRRLLAASLLLLSAPLAAQESTADYLDTERAWTADKGCEANPITTNPNEILVCRTRKSGDRYRLPFRAPPGSSRNGRIAGEVPRATTDFQTATECGIFEGQRRCSKSDMRAAGYGGARSPLAVVTGFARVVFDPDAASGDPPAQDGAAR